MTPESLSSSLCAQCGFCCNGVIFADVHLQSGDDVGRLRKLLALRERRGSKPGLPGFCQPCSALDGVLCRIYQERPQHCRHFECLLFQKVRENRTGLPAALRTVKTSQRLVERILGLLRDLGDEDEHLPLERRLRRTGKRLERMELDAGRAAAYGRLTLAEHRLNTILQAKFYPG
jgi:Fe-S-cluster containining protein